MLTRSICLAGLLAVGSYAQADTTASSNVIVLSGTNQAPTSTSRSLSYASLGSQITDTDRYRTVSSTSSGSSRTGSGSGSGSATASASATSTHTSKGSTSTITLLVGGGGVVTQSVINGTVTLSSPLNLTATSTDSASGTSTAAAPTNTQPCNNYPEFCSRKYSNITEICAHNSAFVVKGNAGSNQALGVTAQLNDGIRMIQGETHLVNNTMYNCHTTCDLLNAGTMQSELEIIADWVKAHPYDVVTLLIVNSDFVDVGNYTAPLQNSGLGPYLYEPPYIPMRRDDWPTLSEMILTQKRVVAFMDYQADQKAVPYILDQYSHMWETPFSPEDRAFPCTTNRPPNLDQKVAKDDLMYLANHNLNTELNLLGMSILVPNTAQINETNANGTDYGMLGAMAENCTAQWDRPPNFLVVDYYNEGPFPGSVFEVAARHNNVTYNRPCCGVVPENSAVSRSSSVLGMVVALVAVLAVVV